MTISPPPLLSIGIPTHNRAERLRLTLDNVLSEAEPLGNLVEVVVSDNASDDHTAQVLESFGPRLRYGIRSSNGGYYANSLEIASRLARGSRLWLLGDDDMILPGRLPELVEDLRSHPGTDVFYLNHSWIPLEERDAIIRKAHPLRSFAPEACAFYQRESLDLDSLEELATLPNRNAAGIFCGMFSYILLRQRFLDFSGIVSPRLWDCFATDVDDIYPHAKVLAAAFHGRRARLIGEPCLVQGVGAHEWGRYASFYKVTPLHQLLAYFESLGIAPGIMDRMWGDLDATAGRNVARMLLDPEHNHGIEVFTETTLPELKKREGFWRFLTCELKAKAPEGWERALSRIR